MKSCLKRHIAQAHCETIVVECQICQKQLSSEPGLLAHYAKLHLPTSRAQLRALYNYKMVNGHWALPEASLNEARSQELVPAKASAQSRKPRPTKAQQKDYENPLLALKRLQCFDAAAMDSGIEDSNPPTNAEPTPRFVTDPTATAVVDPTVTTVVDPTANAVVDPIVTTVVDPIVTTVVDPAVTTVVDPTVSAVVDPTQRRFLDTNSALNLPNSETLELKVFDNLFDVASTQSRDLISTHVTDPSEYENVANCVANPLVDEVAKRVVELITPQLSVIMEKVLENNETQGNIESLHNSTNLSVHLSGKCLSALKRVCNNTNREPLTFCRQTVRSYLPIDSDNKLTALENGLAGDANLRDQFVSFKSTF